jgi:hypothetical protein
MCIVETVVAVAVWGLRKMIAQQREEQTVSRIRSALPVCRKSDYRPNNCVSSTSSRQGHFLEQPDAVFGLLTGFGSFAQLLQGLARVSGVPRATGGNKRGGELFWWARLWYARRL